MKLQRKFMLKPATAILLLAGTAVASASGALAFADDLAGPAVREAQLQTPQAQVHKYGSHQSLADMVAAVGDSVVQIEAADQEQASLFSHGYRAPPQAASAQGSGFIIDASGLIITNNHVVGRASSVKVKLSDGRELRGSVLGRDPKTDLAVVRVAGGGALKAIRWGDSDGARVGESVFAVGSPFGLGNSVTAGIISARGREIGAGPYDDFLQVDAAINSGNSGGPLFDANGRVLGVNTAIFSPSGGNVGIGFAIPAHLARKIAQDIVDNGSVSRGRVGVGLQTLTPDIAAALGVEEVRGALIAGVDPRGSAAASGLRPGDVILSFGGEEVEDSRMFARMVADTTSPRRVPVTVARAGRPIQLELMIQIDRG